MKSCIQLVFVGIFIFSSEVRADAGLKGNFCVTAEQIDENTTSCDDNILFVQYADRCVDRLDEHVNSAAAALGGKFVKNDGAKQTINFDSSLKDYGFSSTTLAKLIAMNKQAIEDVSDYYDTVVIPEDADNPYATEGMDPQEWSDSWPCYGESRESIKHVVKVLNDRLSALTLAKQIADANGATSDSREQKIGQMGSLGAKQVSGKSRGEGSGKGIPTGQSQNGASDITGVQHDKDKQNQAPGH